VRVAGTPKIFTVPTVLIVHVAFHPKRTVGVEIEVVSLNHVRHFSIALARKGVLVGESLVVRITSENAEAVRESGDVGLRGVLRHKVVDSTDRPQWRKLLAGRGIVDPIEF
jgi:hypothetical protein